MQDIFLTETAEFADVILPATSYLEKEGTYTNTDRRVQRGRKVLGAARRGAGGLVDHPGDRPPGRAGLDYSSPREVFDEMVPLMPNYADLSYDNLGGTGKLYPNDDPEHSRRHRRAVRRAVQHRRRAGPPGAGRVAAGQGAAGRGVPVRAQHRPAAGALAHRLDDPPLVRAGRDRARGRGLPEPRRRGRAMGWSTATWSGSRSRRGAIELRAQVSHREAPRHVFIPFHFREAAANLLTIDAIDPVGKIPEFKFCAVGVEPARDATRVSRRSARDGRRLPGCRAVPAPRPRGQVPGPSLIPALHAIQRAHGWLPREELVALSRDTRRPLYEIEGLVSFYPHFRTDAAAGVELAVCHDLSCWLRGADERIARAARALRRRPDVEVREVSCLGPLRRRAGRGRRRAPSDSTPPTLVDAAQRRQRGAERPGPTSSGPTTPTTTRAALPRAAPALAGELAPTSWSRR